MKIAEAARHAIEDSTDDYLADEMLPWVVDELKARGYKVFVASGSNTIKVTDA